MVQLPGPHVRTVCELNCRMVHVDAESSADTPGLSYPCVRVQASDGAVGGAADPGDTPVYISDAQDLHPLVYQLLSKAWAVAGRLQAPVASMYAWLLGHRAHGTKRSSRQRRRSSLSIARGPPSAPPPCAWHPAASVLAAADATRTAVYVYDMPAAPGTTAPTNGTRAAGVLSQPRCVLQHPEYQPYVHALAWRACRGTQLAVGTTGGVLIWATQQAGRPPLAARSAGGRSGGPWVQVLPSAVKTARFTALAWSPDGRLLAAASPDLPGVSLWDVAQGTCTQVGAGLAAITLLRWSPCGEYLFGAGAHERFYVWETQAWGYASWDAPPGSGRVSQAAWAPRARVLLLSFVRGGGHLLALHLVRQPPSLEAQLMPVALPDVRLGSGGVSPAGGDGGQAVSEGDGSALAHWAWDASGERLAVALCAPHPAAGCIAVYATSTEPVVHARLLGYARPPPGAFPEAGPWVVEISARPGFGRGALFTLRAASDPGSSLAAALIYNLPLCYK